jgi:hypothetical protein
MTTRHWHEEAVSMAISGHGGQYAGMYGNPVAARMKEILREVTDIAEELENQRREYRAAVEHEAGTRNALFGVAPRRGSLSIRV